MRSLDEMEKVVCEEKQALCGKDVQDQQKQPALAIGVDCEWCEHDIPAIVQLAVARSIFIVDTLSIFNPQPGASANGHELRSRIRQFFLYIFSERFD